MPYTWLVYKEEPKLYNFLFQVQQTPQGMSSTQKLKSAAIFLHDMNKVFSPQQDKWTPLMYSVKEGHTEVVSLLLEQDTVDILATNKVGYMCA